MNPCCSTIHGVFSVPPLNTPPKIPSRVFFYVLIFLALFYNKNHLSFPTNHSFQPLTFNPHYFKHKIQTQKNRLYAEPIISNLVGICGLEPQTSSLSVTRSNQLSYIPVFNYFTLSIYKNQEPLHFLYSHFYCAIIYSCNGILVSVG